MRSIYYYEQSFFGNRNVPEGIFPTLNYTGEALPEDYSVDSAVEYVAFAD
jgi:hypothetical protein